MHVEDETVLENAMCADESYPSVLDSQIIQLAGNHTPRFEPALLDGKVDGIFEVPALRLEVVRPEIHSLGPHDPGK